MRTGAWPAVNRRLPRLPDVLGLVWVTVAGIAVLVPALIHGVHLGSYDFLGQSGLTAHPGAQVHNFNNGDLIDAVMPWKFLTWVQVHQGHLPLWNPYNGLGMPLAFNWQSEPLSLPSLVGYLAPLQYSFDISIAVTILLSGLGTFFLARVLGFGPLSAAYAGTVFELSGPMTGWLGFPLASVMAWLPWLLLFAILLLRGSHRVRYISCFALSLAFAIFGGQPEALALGFIALGIFLVAWFGHARFVSRDAVPFRRILLDIGAATIAGIGLSAPLLLPSLQLTALSNRHSAVVGTGLPLHDLTYIISQGFDGLPVIGSAPLGSGAFFYSESAAFVGMLTVILAALAMATIRRARETAALAIMTLTMGAIVFVPGATNLISRLPGIGNITWLRALMPMALGLALLGGKGLDLLVRERPSSSLRRLFLLLVALAALVLAAMWVFMRTRVDRLIPFIPRSFDIMVRERSFIWPATDIAVAAGVAGILAYSVLRTAGPGAASRAERAVAEAGDEPESGWRWGRWIGAAVLVCETFFLVSSGSTPISSSSQGLVDSPAVTQLQQAVGTSTLGFGGPTTCGKLGVLINANIFYRIHELGLYDPMMPAAYFSAWKNSSGRSAGIPSYSFFCPNVTSARLAREWGVGFILEPPRTPGPEGTAFVRTVGNERLYRVPASAPATVSPMLAGHRFPAPGVPGVPVRVTVPDPASWRLATNSPHSLALRLRLTDVPGWSATVDGHPLPLTGYNGIMLEAEVPPGHHLIELHYWPNTITLGVVLAIASALGLTVAGIVSRSRPTRRVAPPGPSGTPDS